MDANSNRMYTNNVLKPGLRPWACHYDYAAELKTEPGKGTAGGNVDWAATHYYEGAYHQVGLEMAKTELIDPDLSPYYWRDFETDIEAYCLKQGKTSFITVTNHYKDKRDVTISAD